MERRKDASPAIGGSFTVFHPCKANCSDAETSAFIKKPVYSHRATSSHAIAGD
jgi:hypothetical protein